MITQLQETLHYTFRNKTLLTQALTHPSFAAENNCNDNERFEFLGDGLLGFVIGQYLFENFPNCTEGDLSIMRAKIVNAKTLADVARRLNLGAYLFLGKGEDMTGGRMRESNLSNVLEAVLGAAFIDAGFEKSREIILFIFQQELNALPQD